MIHEGYSKVEGVRAIFVRLAKMKCGWAGWRFLFYVQPYREWWSPIDVRVEITDQVNPLSIIEHQPVDPVTG